MSQQDSAFFEFRQSGHDGQSAIRSDLIYAFVEKAGGTEIWYTTPDAARDHMRSAEPLAVLLKRWRGHSDPPIPKALDLPDGSDFPPYRLEE